MRHFDTWLAKNGTFGKRPRGIFLQVVWNQIGQGGRCKENVRTRCDSPGGFAARVPRPAPAATVSRASSQMTSGDSGAYAVVPLTFPYGIFMHKDTPGRGLEFLKDGRFFVLRDGKRIVERRYSVRNDAERSCSICSELESSQCIAFYHVLCCSRS